MKKIIVFVLSLSILAISCGRFGNKETDGKKDMRIVCLSKQLTEYVFALGKGHNIVAVDLSSTYPDSAKLLKTVGYHRALAPEPIIAMKPDLVIHSNDIGPENVLPQITKELDSSINFCVRTKSNQRYPSPKYSRERSAKI